MSGEKHVTVSSVEMRRLREAEARLRSLRGDLPEIINAARRDASAEMQRRMAPFEERQRAFQQAISGFSEEIRRQEETTSRRIAEQHRQSRRELDQAIQSVRGETRQLIQEQERRLTGLIAEERAARRQEMEKVHAQIGSILADRQRARNHAHSWVEAVEKLRAFVEGHYRHQDFAPGELDRLTRLLELARGNVTQGLSEAAIGQAQQAYQGLSDLRLELERLEREWEGWRGAALASAEKVLSEARANQKCRALDLQARDAGIEVEVDYWTGGKLSTLESRLQEIAKRLRSERPGLSTAELRALVEGEVPEMRQLLEQLVQEARLRVIGSQMRVNIADLVVESLETKGYELTDNTYEGEDERGRFVAKLKRRDNSEIVVVISPDESEPIKNELQIHSFDDGAFPADRTQRMKEIGQVLGATGLEVGNIREAASRPDPAVRDIDHVRKQTRQAERAQSKPATR